MYLAPGCHRLISGHGSAKYRCETNRACGPLCERPESDWFESGGVPLISLVLITLCAMLLSGPRSSMRGFGRETAWLTAGFFWRTGALCSPFGPTLFPWVARRV